MRSEENYEANDPILLTSGFPSDLPFPALYADVGDQDDFGFQEGFALLVNALTERGYDHTTEIVPGGHYVFRERGLQALEFIGTHL